MKRSEMIICIARHLSVPNITHPPSSYWLKIAEQALDAAEQAGILPPRVRVEEIRKAISPEGEGGTFVSWTYKSVWEDEDLQNE